MIIKYPVIPLETNVSIYRKHFNFVLFFILQSKIFYFIYLSKFKMINPERKR